MARAEGLTTKWLLLGLATVLGALACNLSGASGPTTSPEPTASEVVTEATARELTPTRGATDTPPPVTATRALAEEPLAPLTQGSAVEIRFVRMHTPLAGWALGGVGVGSDRVLRTPDGGRSWFEVTPPEPAPLAGAGPKEAVLFSLDAERAWVAYAYREFHTIPSVPAVWSSLDGGMSWKKADLALPELAEFYRPSDVFFLDATHGWMMAHVGAGMQHDFIAMFASEDGGLSWRMLFGPEDAILQSCPKTGLAFADPMRGWATRDCQGVVDGAFLDISTDAGRTWQPVELPAPPDQPDFFAPISVCQLHSPTFFGSTRGLVGVECLRDDGQGLTEHHLIYRTTNFGSGWETMSYPGGRVLFLTPELGWAYTRQVHRTEDGGRTWQLAKEVAWDGQFSFVDSSRGWAVATDSGESAFVFTVDGGRTWRQIDVHLAEP